jgi:hypothetical protein
MFRHTTDITNGQSVLERGDLEELMAMVGFSARVEEFFTTRRTLTWHIAEPCRHLSTYTLIFFMLHCQADLADRDFTAERGQAVVIVSGAVDPLAEERNEQERREAETRNRHRLKLPRRPKWTSDMTAEELDLQVIAHW